MVDQDLLYKKLAFIETCVADLRRHARLDRLTQDIREERFVEHTLQLSIQAALDVSSHIVSAERWGEPKTNRALFQKLTTAGWIAGDLAVDLQNMAGFRNILVHGYADVDLSILRDIVEHHLDDLLQFVSCVRDRL